MANDFELITQFAKDILVNQFALESLTKPLETEANSLFRFVDNRTIMIGRSQFDGLASYTRRDGSTGGYKTGSAGIVWDPYKIRYDRGRQFQVDRADNDETNKLAIGTLTKDFNRLAVIPEIDTVRFSLLAEAARDVGGEVVFEADTNKDTVLAEINKAIEWMQERKVPDTDLLLYVNPHYNSLLKQTKELVRTTRPQDFSGNLSNRVMEYENIPIIVVPSNMFYTNVVVDEDNGYYPGTDSKPINFILVARSCVFPVVRYSFSKIYSSDDVVTTFDGYIFNMRVYHDLFVPTNRKVGIYASIGSTINNATIGSITYKNKAGKTTGTTVFSDLVVYPNNLFPAKFAYSTTAVKVGDRIVGGLSSLTNEVIPDTEITIADKTKVYLVAYDSYGKAIAVSPEITVTSKTGG